MIKLYINNVQVYGFSFDVNTGTFESDLTLSYGRNNIRIEYENPCGGEQLKPIKIILNVRVQQLNF